MGQPVRALRPAEEAAHALPGRRVRPAGARLDLAVLARGDMNLRRGLFDRQTEPSSILRHSTDRPCSHCCDTTKACVNVPFNFGQDTWIETASYPVAPEGNGGASASACTAPVPSIARTRSTWDPGVALQPRRH